MRTSFHILTEIKSILSVMKEAKVSLLVRLAAAVAVNPAIEYGELNSPGLNRSGLFFCAERGCVFFENMFNMWL